MVAPAFLWSRTKEMLTRSLLTILLDDLVKQKFMPFFSRNVMDPSKPVAFRSISKPKLIYRDEEQPNYGAAK
jgi:hypothetical protein